jgi:hypothetical protein
VAVIGYLGDGVLVGGCERRGRELGVVVGQGIKGEREACDRPVCCFCDALKIADFDFYMFIADPTRCAVEIQRKLARVMGLFGQINDDGMDIPERIDQIASAVWGGAGIEFGGRFSDLCLGMPACQNRNRGEEIRDDQANGDNPGHSSPSFMG